MIVRRSAFLGGFAIVAIGCGLGILGTEIPAGVSPDADATIESGAIDGPIEGAVDGGDASADAGIDCGDTTSAHDNCGFCGHACVDTECDAGLCATTTLASVAGFPAAVAVDATHVYVAEENSGNIYRTSKSTFDGGVAQFFYATNKAPHDLVIDGDRIFWADQFRIGVRPFAGGGGPVDVDGGVRAIAAGGNMIYFVNKDTFGVFTRDLVTRGPDVSTPNAEPAIAANGTHVYWTAGSEIRRVALGTTTVEAVVTGVVVPPPYTAALGIALDASYVYWSTATEIRRAAIGTWTPVTIASGETQARSLVVDGGNIYWLDVTKGLVRRAPITGITGGAAETLAIAPQGGFPFPRAIAVDGPYVYFVSSANQTVARVAK